MAQNWKEEVREAFFWINPDDYGDTVDPTPHFVGRPEDLIKYIEELLEKQKNGEIS